MSSRRRQLAGICGLGVRRVVGRLRTGARGRTLVSITGVALAVALLVVVTSLSAGLAGGATVQSEDIDYWIVPDESGAGSVPLNAEGAQLSEVHRITAQLRADSRINYVTPVAITPIQLRHPATNEQTYVLVLGVIPESGRHVAGLNTTPLADSYVHYDNGSYAGPWTGQMVISPAVATELNVTQRDELALGGSTRTGTVSHVTDTNLDAGVGEVPAIVMPLAELQTLTGQASSDTADQILVSTTDPSVQSLLTDIYPGTSVVSRVGLAGAETSTTNLPLAMALAATVVAGGIGVAFVATMMGLELTASRQEIAILGAVGFSTRARVLVVITETVTVAILGGLLGVALGSVGIVGLNAAIAEFVGVTTLATLTPGIILYALAAAVAVGVLAVPYPLYLATQTDVLAALTR
ncbi:MULTISPECIES: FtsX-like permease family protein [unclassified Halorubrum]|uniref:FtsX-like permease family protein n=1 Tax=unclassified Halorubrum TaxID=2642239 RepID=UPI001F4769D2|nr:MULTISPECIES: FtsX-like permease family protein [unclassified Halorubrum]